MSSMELAQRFTAWDYVVFTATLAVSGGIGLIFACIGGKQKTTAEVLLGNRMMSVLPTSMSLLASFTSAVLIMGMPAEIYSHGTMNVWQIAAYPLAILLSTQLYIPVFYRLKLTSVFEYLERRFNQTVRIIAVSIYVLQMALYMAIVLYVPSLALSAVTGIKTWVAVISVGVVCTIYTSAGGMKAVMWTDTFQICVMVAGMLSVIIRGCLMLGVDNILSDATKSGRMDFFTMKALNPSLQERHTAFGLIIGLGLAWTANFGVNQACVQRALSVPTLAQAKIAYWINLIGLLLFTPGAMFTGLILYSHYKDCDPVKSGKVIASDQMFIVYVLEVLGHLPGLPGLVVSAAFCGSLSTLSSGYNSLAAVLLTDILNPKFKMADERAAMVSKGLAAGFGALSIALAFVVAQLGSFFTQVAMTTFGMIGGPLLAVFTMGIFYPWINSKGAIAGLIMSLAFTAWLGVGSAIYPPYIHKYPISMTGCHNNDSLHGNFTQRMNDNALATPRYSSMAGNFTLELLVDNSNGTQSTSIEDAMNESRFSGMKGLYSLSYTLMTPLALLICTVVSHFVSAVTGFNSPCDVDPSLISPVYERLSRYFPKRWNCQLRSTSNLSSNQNVTDEEANKAETKLS